MYCNIIFFVYICAMKDFYYMVKALFLIIVTILMLMLYSDYHEDRKYKEDLREEISPGLQKLIDSLT